MRWLLIAALLLTGAPAAADDMLLLGVGQGGAPAPPAVYVGPVDTVPAPKEAWSLSAVSAATRGANSVRVCNVGDVACADFVTHAVTGDLVITTIGGSDCAIVTCTVKTVYGQINGIDLTFATIANRPTLVVNCKNSLPCMDFNGSQSLVGTWTSANQPYTYMAVGIQITTSGFPPEIFSAFNGGGSEFGFEASSGSVRMYAGADLAATATNNTWNVMIGVFNGASSVSSVNNVDTTGPAGSGATGTGPTIGSAHGGSNWMIGRVTQIIAWPAAVSAGDRATLCHGAYVRWGTSVSC